MYEVNKLSLEEKLALRAYRLERGYPLHAPPHVEDESGPRLISAACLQHQRIFDSSRLLSELAKELLETMKRENFPCDAWVVLPNHYHLLLHIDSMARLGETIRKMHSRIATRVNGLAGKRGRRVWYRHTDRRMRSAAHYWATVNYIHGNPVKHGYVREQDDWPWSSWLDYMDDHGRVRMADWERQHPALDYGRGWDDH